MRVSSSPWPAPCWLLGLATSPSSPSSPTRSARSAATQRQWVQMRHLPVTLMQPPRPLQVVFAKKPVKHFERKESFIESFIWVDAASDGLSAKARKKAAKQARRSAAAASGSAEAAPLAGPPQEQAQAAMAPPSTARPLHNQDAAGKLKSLWCTEARPAVHACQAAGLVLVLAGPGFCFAPGPGPGPGAGFGLGECMLITQLACALHGSIHDAIYSCVLHSEAFTCKVVVAACVKVCCLSVCRW